MAFRSPGKTPDRVILSEVQVLLEQYLSIRVPLNGGERVMTQDEMR